jgi:DNA polymerase III epsilon subunit family exonuclease
MLNEYIIIDTETTGLNYKTDRVIEIGAIKIVNSQIVEKFDMLVDSVEEVPQVIQKITGITKRDLLKEGERPEDVYPKLREFISDYTLVAHNAQFDYKFLNAEMYRYNIDPITNPYVCTLKLARKSIPGLFNHKLTTIKHHLNLKFESHRALADTMVCFEIMKRYNSMAITKTGGFNDDDYSGRLFS